jgi:[ribosomal protein S18]-alanine N-acetyltransferase
MRPASDGVDSRPGGVDDRGSTGGRVGSEADLGSRIRIRDARPGDLGRVAEVEASCFTTPWSPSSFRSLIGQERVTFLVAETVAGADPIVVGHGVLWRIADEAELANLAVSPDAQGRGVAGALLDRLLEEASDTGVLTVFLEVRASNRAALRLYEGRGFRQIGLRSQYYDRPREDARVLRLDLTREANHPNRDLETQ